MCAAEGMFVCAIDRGGREAEGVCVTDGARYHKRWMLTGRQFDRTISGIEFVFPLRDFL